ncbi:MAG: hypothetical protein L6R35_003660, partial [Caloplaca aegaea]
MTDKQPPPPKYRSLASREKRPSPFGTTLFVGLRAADAILQYHLLRHNWAHQAIRALHGVPITGVSSAAGGGGGLLGLTPYGTIISALALGSSLKQIIFTTIISEQEMRPGPALAIAAFNTVFNTANTLLSVWTFSSVAPTTPTPTHIPPPPFPPRRHYAFIASSPALLAGIALYAVGMVLELGSEVQRKRFKAKPENQGKPYDGGGLWAWATH